MQTLLDKDKVKNIFDEFRKDNARLEPCWLEDIRESAFSAYHHLDFPSKKNEDWKYTDVSSFVQTPFETEISSNQNLNDNDLKALPLINEIPYRLIFINGQYNPQLSSLPKLEKLIKVLSLKNAVSSEPELLKKHLGQFISFDKNIFSAINAAMFQDGVFIYLPKETQISEPIQLFFISTSGSQNPLSQPRNLIILDQKSKATFIEHHLSLGEGVSLTNAATEIILHQDAQLNWYKIQSKNENSHLLDTTYAHLAQDASFKCFTASLKGQWTRNNLNIVLAEERASCVLNGLYLVSGTQHVDHHTLVDHLKPQGNSHQIYKGILDEKGTAVFSGKVFVHRNAQKTDASQTNKNLLLSKGAKIDTKPQLEIFADDVKCKHGAAVGQLEDEAVFYLKSRGIGSERAQSILSYAFASEVVETVDLEPLKHFLNEILLSKFEKRGSHD